MLGFLEIPHRGVMHEILRTCKADFLNFITPGLQSVQYASRINTYLLLDSA